MWLRRGRGGGEGHEATARAATHPRQSPDDHPPRPAVGGVAPEAWTIRRISKPRAKHEMHGTLTSPHQRTTPTVTSNPRGRSRPSVRTWTRSAGWPWSLGDPSLRQGHLWKVILATPPSVAARFSRRPPAVLTAQPSDRKMSAGSSNGAVDSSWSSAAVRGALVGRQRRRSWRGGSGRPAGGRRRLRKRARLEAAPRSDRGRGSSGSRTGMRWPPARPPPPIRPIRPTDARRGRPRATARARPPGDALLGGEAGRDADMVELYPPSSKGEQQ